MKKTNVRWQPLAALAVLAVFFWLLYHVDNKYQTPPPYGKSGFITLKEQNLERGLLSFLLMAGCSRMNR